MIDGLLQAAWLLADAAPAAEPRNPLAQMVTLLPLILVAFYFIIVRPQRRQQQVSELKKNDYVLTIGGIYGTVVGVRKEHDEVTLRIDETTNAKIRVTLGAISKVITATPAAEKEKTAT